VRQVHEEEARERAVASTVEREKTATAAVKQLQVQLKEEKASHDDDMGQKKQVLGVLKDQLKGLKTTYASPRKGFWLRQANGAV
jgi:hypothetical protein